MYIWITRTADVLMRLLLSLLFLTLLNHVVKSLNPSIWQSLESCLPSSQIPEPLVHDSTLHPSKPELSDLATLYRERNGWCPYSQRAWLAFEVKNVPYDTVLIDNMGSRPR